MQRRLTHPISSITNSQSQAERAGGRPPAPKPLGPHTLPECLRSGAPVHDALALTSGGNVAHITLNDQLYVLRITRAGKLILTK